jgi:hypothetical protein
VRRGAATPPRRPLIALTLRKNRVSLWFDTSFPQSYLLFKFKAKHIAFSTSVNFSWDSATISAPTFDLETVWIWSQLMAQS